MESPLRIVIVEDEPVSSIYLEKKISETGKPFQVVGKVDSVSEGLLYFTENSSSFDLVFMDIQLGDGTCFDLLNEVSIQKPIIFCTTFDNYAMQAFKYNSIDYLLKPVNSEDVDNALTKYSSIYSTNTSTEVDYFSRLDNALKSLQQTSGTKKKRFLIRTENHLEIVYIEDIVCFYSEEGQSYIVDNKGAVFATEYTLDRIEEMVSSDEFFRINRKAMIRIETIKSIEDYVNNRLKVFLNIDAINFDLIVSRNRVKEFKNWIRGN